MAPEVRLIGPDNEPLGVVSLAEALRLAGEQDVDLVEVVAAANPPVCRLIEYGKFKYHEQKKAAEAKVEAEGHRGQGNQVPARAPTTATTTSRCATSGAFWTKATSARSRCASAAARSRTRNSAWRCCSASATNSATLIVVEQFPKLEGRQMIMMIAPGRKKAGGGAAKPAAEPTTAPAAA